MQLPARPAQLSGAPIRQAGRRMHDSAGQLSQRDEAPSLKTASEHADQRINMRACYALNSADSNPCVTTTVARKVKPRGGRVLR